MPAEIEINDDDIKRTERILLNKGDSFDEERINFIKNLDTIDLQAVPGSGKTTALLAKLLAIETKLPLKDGSGILVLSHTNAAIDEIKNILGLHCTKLMCHPNYIGTIQSFVNTFLAQPYAINELNTKIETIDNDIYKNNIWNEFYKIQWEKKYGKMATYFWSRNLNASRAIAKNSNLTVKQICQQKIREEVQNLYFDFRDESIKNFKNDKVLLKTKSNSKYKGLKKCIVNTLKNGIINYKYAYKLALHYSIINPHLLNLIRKRFSLVFVDEMQDMNLDQYNLLEMIFYDNEKSGSSFQRIGDKNQSIYDGKLLDEEVWQERDNLLTIQGSHRLTVKNANVVAPFSLYGTQDEEFKIKSLSKEGIKPQLMVFNNQTIDDVIPFYSQLINDLQKRNKISKNSKFPHCVVAWNTDWSSEADREDENKIRLVDYYPNFKKELTLKKEDFPNLKTSLLPLIILNPSTKEIIDNLIKSILKVFRIEGITLDDKRINKTMFLSNLKEVREDYNYFKISMYQITKNLVNGELEEANSIFVKYIKEFFDKYEIKINHSKSFIESTNVDLQFEKLHFTESGLNILLLNGIEIQLNTVHAVKGKTHATTLYLESSYHNKYESERLTNQFKGIPFPTDESRKRHKHSTLMAYVGLSRAKELICVAIHEDRYEKFFSDLDKEIWDTHEL